MGFLKQYSLKQLGKHGSVGKCQGSLKRLAKILIHGLLCDYHLFLVSSPQPYVVLGVAKWKAISVL